MVRSRQARASSYTSASQYVNTGAVRQSGQYYLDRNFLINSTTTNADVILPFLTDEMDDLTAADPGSNIGTVGVTRVSGSSCTNNFAGGTTFFYNQALSGSGNGVDWVQFQTAGFSNFFINRVAALPLELKSFTGKTTPTSNMLLWETLTEKNVQSHIVERSVDGIKWLEIGRKSRPNGFSGCCEIRTGRPRAIGKSLLPPAFGGF
ncbi:MAG: hypothetical protein IPL27_13675 [Lewinellaceae bacterium]|nr:hypothetical protein [Lewinellaceae bacterium]